jgi:PhzF family phenazine biosynthesis protein
MKLELWQVDAFASRPFEGNPAAIVPLEAWLPDETLQAIALENNLSETAFLVRETEGTYALRWFTPAAEVELCGHATLAAGFVVFTALASALNAVSFSTRSGELIVTRRNDSLLSMSLPADKSEPIANGAALAEKLGVILGVPPPDEIHGSRYLLVVWNDPAAIREIRPSTEMTLILREVKQWGLIATAVSDTEPYDFVSRFFAPDKGILEDPVTGSAHCVLTPFWAERLGKTKLRAFQASPRDGDILCTHEKARVTLSGNCALYMRGEITI